MVAPVLWLQEPHRAVFHWKTNPASLYCYQLFLRLIFKWENQHNLSECTSQALAFWSSPNSSGGSQWEQIRGALRLKLLPLTPQTPSCTLREERAWSSPTFCMNRTFPVTHILSNTWLKEKPSLQGRQKTKAGLNTGKTDPQVCQRINCSIQWGAILFIICEHL